MNLFLSRICLNPLFPPALKLAADPYELHRKLLDTLHEHCVPRIQGEKPQVDNQPKTAPLLFRVETSDAGPAILIQSEVEPDWDAFEIAPRALRLPPQTKSFSPTFHAGHRLSFRLLCQPVKRQSGQFGMKPNGKRRPGPRRACRNEEERLQWLARKGEQHGMRIESVGVTYVSWRNSKPLQQRGGAVVEQVADARRRAFGTDGHQKLGAVLFDGILHVVDAELFLEAIRSGIGPAKAFGFGLLSVGPAN